MLFLLLSETVFAQQSAFRYVDGQQQSRTIPYTLKNIEGIEYLSLPEVIQSLGGAQTVMPRRMRVDLAGTTAWISLNDTRVKALSYFSLRHKVISNDDGIFISRVDCPIFFKKAFQVTLTPATGASIPIMSNKTLDKKVFAGDTTPDLETITIPSIPKEMKPGSIRTILLDPGHGGYDRGVTGASGATEKDIVLSIAQKVKSILEKDKSIRIVLSRDKDVSLSDQQRVAIFRERKADMLITLHAGGSFSGEMEGIAVFYPAKPKRIPNSVTDASPYQSYTATSHNYAKRLAAAIERETNASNRGIHAVPNSLFSMVNSPACLIEIGCLTNQAEEVSLSDDAYQAKIAAGIAQGILVIVTGKEATRAPETLSNKTAEQNDADEAEKS